MVLHRGFDHGIHLKVHIGELANSLGYGWSIFIFKSSSRPIKRSRIQSQRYAAFDTLTTMVCVRLRKERTMFV